MSQNNYSIIIPARLQSSRLPQKLLQKIGTKTILEHSYLAAKKSNASKIIIAVDDQLLYKLASQFCEHVIMTDKDHQSGSDRLGECVDKLHLADNEIIVNLQADEPFMPASLLDLCAKTLIDDPEAQMATLAQKINDPAKISDPNAVKVILNQKQQAIYFSRAAIPFDRDQTNTTLKGCYHHLGIYAYKAGFLKTYKTLAQSDIEHIEKLEQLRILWHGYKIAVATTPIKLVKGIDTPDDLKQAKKYFQNMNKT